MSTVEAPPKEGKRPSVAEPDSAWVADLEDLMSSIGVPPAGPLPQPPSPPHPHHRGRRLATITALVALLVIVYAAIILSHPSHSTAPADIPAALKQGGKLVSVHSKGAGELVVLVPSGHLVYVSMAGKQVLSQDGQMLLLSSLRPGDFLRMRSATTVADTAQSQRSLQGIVASAPDPDGDVMTVQLSPTRTVLVDIGSQTRINGRLPSASARMSIQESSQVRMVGILDETFDEITQTWAINVVEDAQLASSR